MIISLLSILNWIFEYLNDRNDTLLKYNTSTNNKVIFIMSISRNLNFLVHCFIASILKLEK